MLDAAADRIMIESEDITEDVGDNWRTDVISAIVRSLPQDKVMYEAVDPKVRSPSRSHCHHPRTNIHISHDVFCFQVFAWYIQQFGVDVNLFVDHSQTVQLAIARAGIWGTSSTFGRITSYKG